MPSYLVTGCAGFIGAKVSEILLKQGHRVVGVDDLSDGYDPRLKHYRLAALQQDECFHFIKGDIRDAKSLSPAFSLGDHEALLNLGARAGVRQSVANPWLYAQSNYLAVINLLELCREYGIEKFVQASTSSVYGNDTRPPFQETASASMPVSPYAASKKAAETICYSYHFNYDIDITVFRFFTVYGPAGRPDMSVFRFVRAIAEDEPLTLYGDGGERDFTHVDDVADGVIAGLRPLGHEIINLGGDRPVKIAHLISLIEETLGKKAEINVVPRPSVDVDSTWADISKARRLLGWQPHIDLESGIRDVVDWYLKNRQWAREVLG
ncbi:MAG: NAD-dependent epimerase/dehydratase family protein [Dehalococcoidia bacterium]|nr:NAD-dependent epimerase/dehydratase family protein [Dehalococcoidia bacterium]